MPEQATSFYPKRQSGRTERFSEESTLIIGCVKLCKMVIIIYIIVFS